MKETPEQFRRRMEEKAARQRRFADLDRVAAQSQIGVPRKRRTSSIVEPEEDE